MRAIGSFLLLSPTIAVVTNIEADHLDHYKDLEDIKDSVSVIREQGSVLWRRDPVP